MILELQFLMTVVCVLSELNMEYNPSDHPRASTIFLSKSQTDGECVCVYVSGFHLLNCFRNDVGMV